MKRFIIFSLLLVIQTQSLYSQSLEVRGYLNGEIKDIIYLGINENSTIGVDSNLGELDIFDTPLNDFDIRILQRDSSNFDCLYNIEDNLNFQEISYQPNNSFDSKVNYRNGSEGEHFFFEVRNFTQNFDKIEIFSSTPINDYLIRIWTINNCNIQEALSIDIESLSFPLNVLDFSITPNEIQTMIIQFDTTIISNSTEINSEFSDKSLNIYPNPFSSLINIENLGIDCEIEIYDLFGRLLFNLENNSTQTIQINPLIFENGLYYLIMTDKTNGSKLVEKILKN